MRFQVTEKNTKITGRTLFKDGVCYLAYSGSSISFTFKGKKADICVLSDEKDWVEELKARIAIYVNNEEIPVKRICLNQEEAVYPIFDSNEETTVTITIMKYSEAAFGMCGIRYIEIDTDYLLNPPAKKERKMEIIGDSITCGYGVEAESELDPFHTATENPEKSYSMITAKALNADVHLFSWSGNGIISKYVEETAIEPLTDDLMPKMYPYTDLSGSKRLYKEDSSKWEKWDFSKFVPDIILINLGTNDCSWCKDIRERKDHFLQEYIRFLKEVRNKNQKAEILCMLGTMDQRVLKEIETAVDRVVKEDKDLHIHFLALPAQAAEDGYGADWHPSLKTHKMTAELVVREVKRIMNW